MKIIGITGGVGSGKSEILNILKNDYQAKVIQSDHVAHELMVPGAKSYDAIVRTSKFISWIILFVSNTSFRLIMMPPH